MSLKYIKIPTPLSTLSKFHKNKRQLEARRRVILTADRYFSSHQICKLHIGSGGHILDGWLNSDIAPGESEVFLDCSEAFPFETETFDYIFSEHCFEHLAFEKGVLMLRESFRILKAGGKIRLSTPNISFLVDLYEEPDLPRNRRYIEWATKQFLPVQSGMHLYSPVYVINNFFRDWGHRLIYDLHSITGLLEMVGFNDISRREVGSSDDDNLRGLEQHGEVIPREFNLLETIVIEAIK